MDRPVGRQGHASEQRDGQPDVLAPEEPGSAADRLTPIRQNPVPEAPLYPEEAVLLDLTQDMDDRIYRNLIADIVFFPALEDAEVEELANWRERIRALIVDGRSLCSGAVLQAGWESGSRAYRWRGGEYAEEYAM